ncbi:RDD family protein [Microlunatus antarcticus]|uniref:Putative RDD family membrane protein YckC n=1 Tax=Microlunatus antarcticus TaxID=53388 RepID=A0A7W5P8F1_9ACTN|nr:putative RDD family membrane protein YckC [Microlunatus antarcticus]
MAEQAAGTAGESDYPGERVGLPQAGPGSLASWGSRIAALIVDWVICTVVAVLLFGTRVVTGQGWTSWMTLSVFFVETTVLCVLAGGSAGQLICRLAVGRVDRTQLGLVRSALRAAMVCVVLPAVVIGTDRRGLHDLAAGTVVVNRR